MLICAVSPLPRPTDSPPEWFAFSRGKSRTHTNKLDRTIQREIVDYLERRVAAAEDPRKFGKPLRPSKFGLWRYRLRDYRIICELQEKRLMVLVVAVSHRSTIYDD